MNTAISNRHFSLLCGFILTCLAAPALAEGNLLANPNFNNGLSGWQNPYGGVASWSSRDAGNSGASGSAVVVNDLNPSNGGTVWVLAQCVSATPSTIYEFGGKLLVPSGQPAGTTAFLLVDAFASADCTGSIADSDNESSDNVEEWELESSDFTTGSGIHSIYFMLAVYKPQGVTANASAHFDDVFLRLAQGSNGTPVNPSMSASWYNSAESGHGIMLDLLDATQAWMCWFTFDLDGNASWICALGNISGDTIVFANAFTVEGGAFPPLFDPQQIAEVPWGSITLEFSGCNSATMSWTTTVPGFQSGNMPLQRLTPLWGVACP
jgi:hypothetical protein